MSENVFSFNIIPTTKWGYSTAQNQQTGFRSGDRVFTLRYELHLSISFRMIYVCVLLILCQRVPNVHTRFDINRTHYTHTHFVPHVKYTVLHIAEYRGAGKSLARPGRKQATATKL